MNRTKVVFSFLFALLLGLCLYRLLSVPSRVSAFSSGSPPSQTGAPGEGTCQAATIPMILVILRGGVTIDGLPDSYVAGGALSRLQ
jgi:hypothetical protein